MSRRSIPRRLFEMALPVIGLNVLGVLALAVDTLMVGHLSEGEVGLTALGFATQVVFLLFVAMMGLSVGAVSLVARAHGGGSRERSDHILLQASYLTAGVGLAVAVGGNLLAEPLLVALGATEETVSVGLEYLRPTLTFAIFPYLSLLYASVLRGVGETLLPFLVGLFANGLNVALNYGLILGGYGLPALGVAGAAWGTVISQAVGALLLALLLRRGIVPALRLRWRWEPVDRELAAQLYRVGAPAALDMVVLNLSFMSIVAMLGWTQEVAVAAHGIGLRIQILAFVPGLGVAQATAAMVGMALGADNAAQARAIVRASVALCMSMMTLLGLITYLGAESIVGAFGPRAGTPLFELSVLWVRLLGWGMPLAGMHISYVGMLRGAGDTAASLRINTMGTLAVQIPLSVLLGFVLGLGPLGIWVGFPISVGAKALLGHLAYRRNRWAQTGLTFGARAAPR